MGKIDPNEHFSAPRTCTENEKEEKTQSLVALPRTIHLVPILLSILMGQLPLSFFFSTARRTRLLLFCRFPSITALAMSIR